MTPELARQLALGYASGREDVSGIQTASAAGTEPGNSGWIDFARAFAAGQTAYDAGQRGTMTNPRDAYEVWQATAGRTIFREEAPEVQLREIRQAMRSAAGTPAYVTLKARARGIEAQLRDASTTEALIREARGWIADCFEDVDVASLSDFQVREGIEQHYAGGWAQFVRDGAALTEDGGPFSQYRLARRVYDPPAADKHKRCSYMSSNGQQCDLNENHAPFTHELRGQGLR